MTNKANQFQQQPQSLLNSLPKATISPMLDTVSRYLVRIGIDYEVIDDGQGVDFDVQSPAGNWRCLFALHQRTGMGIYSTIPTPTPRRKFGQMAVYLMYLNNRQLFGNFELDIKTGDVRFKTYLDCDANELTERLIDRTMLRNVTTMQLYMPHILHIICAA